MTFRTLVAGAAIVVALDALTRPLDAQTIDSTFTQQQKLEALDARAGDGTGFSVAISGETIVVGAPFEDGGQGAAYVFVRGAGGWISQQKLVASTATPGDSFGWSVAISGETIVVGAPSDHGGSVDPGSAYVFVRGGAGWIEQQTLHAWSPAAGDTFGSSVAIDGETVVVGAPRSDDKVGAAYVFLRSEGVWNLPQKLVGSSAEAGDQFGYSVAISGATIVVGARFDDGTDLDQGSAYVFVRGDAGWSEQTKLEASDAAEGTYFGWSVAISGETVVVGVPYDDDAQGSARVFVRSEGVWREQPKLVAADAAASDFFGWSVAISGDTIVIGAQLSDGGDAGFVNQGAAYVFVRSGDVWSLRQKLVASDAALADRFGFSVAISGETVVVGAVGGGGAAGDDPGSAYVFGPDVPTRIEHLIGDIRGLALSEGFTTSLVAKLNDAITSFTAGDASGACDALTAFVNEVNAQTQSPAHPNKNLTPDQTQYLLTKAGEIQAAIGCQ